MLLVLRSSSIKLISLIALRDSSPSTAMQNMIGAAFLKFNQKSLSLDSLTSSLRIIGSGAAEYCGVGVVAQSLLTCSREVSILVASF